MLRYFVCRMLLFLLPRFLRAYEFFSVIRQTGKSYRQGTLPSNLPRHPTAAHSSGNLQP